MQYWLLCSSRLIVVVAILGLAPLAMRSTFNSNTTSTRKLVVVVVVVVVIVVVVNYWPSYNNSQIRLREDGRCAIGAAGCAKHLQ